MEEVTCELPGNLLLPLPFLELLTFFSSSAGAIDVGMPHVDHVICGLRFQFVLNNISRIKFEILKSLICHVIVNLVYNSNVF